VSETFTRSAVDDSAVEVLGQRRERDTNGATHCTEGYFELLR
jgi:hypothetical protein